MENNNEEIKKIEENVVDEVSTGTEKDVEKAEIGGTTKGKKSKKKIIIVVLLLLVLVVVLVLFLLKYNNKPVETTTIKTDSREVASEYRISGNSLEAFDLYFLQLENKEVNKVYSPLSIKYALEMLSEGASGDTKTQIDNIVGDYKANKYPNNEHMSFANAMFIKNSFKDSVNKEYTNNLVNKYGAEVIYDSFDTPDNINNWVSDRTFKLVNNLVDDASKNKFFLINALAIDMNWNNQIHCTSDHKIPCLNRGIYSINYAHEKLDEESKHSYSVTDYPYTSENDFYGDSYRKHIFNGDENIKGGDILADYNKYDIIKEVGEDKIREIVRPLYTEWLKTEEGKSLSNSVWFPSNVDEYLDKYINEIKANYGKGANSTDFLVYEDENTRAFAKDLQEYDGKTLQYVGIMPKNVQLSEFIKSSTSDSINKIINDLKEVNIDSFEEGYATRIRGFIPFFKFEYELQLMDDLKKMGIKDVFDTEKADLSKLTNSSGVYIDKAIHKANIEFSNDGIKASAATTLGGYGATGGGFDYVFKIPVKDIDMTFDKPYMYIIRDKKSGEVWFMGTVYEPIKK